MTFTHAELTAADVPAVAHLHRLAFPNFFLSSLGAKFLAQFYYGFVDDPTSITIVARDDTGLIRGVAVGTSHPRGFFGRLLRRRWRRFMFLSAHAALANPRSIPRLLRALTYRGDKPPGVDGAQLCSVCVDPTARGCGEGKRLIDGWISGLSTRNISAAFLLTDAEGNDSVNHFYRSGGWQLLDTFATRTGRIMNRYTLIVGDAACSR